MTLTAFLIRKKIQPKLQELIESTIEILKNKNYFRRELLDIFGKPLIQTLKKYSHSKELYAAIKKDCNMLKQKWKPW